MKIPTRPAPPVPQGEPIRENYGSTNNPKRIAEKGLQKKKPPPRPPPPKFNNSLIQWNDDSSSTGNKHYSSINNFSSKPNKPEFTTSLLDLSIPSSDDFPNVKPVNSKPSTSFAVGNSSFFGSDSLNYLDLSNGTKSLHEPEPLHKPSNAPTIIRAQPKSRKPYGTCPVVDSRTERDYNNYSPPMPTIPPPSPPKNFSNFYSEDAVPHGVALYNYFPTHNDDLSFQVNDIIILLRKVNDEWLYGKIGDSEGMFPTNFVDIRVPLEETSSVVTALYVFNSGAAEDLKLEVGQKVRVLKRVSEDWLYGESNGNYGQFPANFVSNIPRNI